MWWLLSERVGLAVLFAGTALGMADAQLPPPPPPPSISLPGMSGRDGKPAEKTGTGVLSGRVVSAEGGMPLRRALVRVMAQELAQPRSVSTDADGRWQVKDLPAGSYRVSVSKGGYIDIAYGQRRPFEAGKVLELAEGKMMDKLDVTLPRAGVITGRVVDEFGEPITGARVSPLRYRHVYGRRQLTPLAAVDTTDDIGQFRLYGLPPGDYFISAQMASGLLFGQSDDRVGYGTTYFPGTGSAGDAQRVKVTIGQETANVIMTMAPSRVAIISGAVTSSSGSPINRGSMMLTSNIGGAMTGLSTQIKPDGSFLFSNIPPGDYRIHVHHTPPGTGDTNGGTEYASLPVTVAGADITGLSLVTSVGAVVSGRIVFEGADKPPVAPAALSLMPIPLQVDVMTPSNAVRIRDDWSFETVGLTERRRFQIPNLPPGWYLKSVTHEATDVTDSGIDFQDGLQVGGIEIRLTQRAAEITGSVQDGQARSVTDYVVVAFAADRAKWGYQSRFVRAARPNQDGRFSMKGMPPEDYLVVALDYLEAGEESDPEQLEKWRDSATRLSLSDGEQKTLSLKLNQ